MTPAINVVPARRPAEDSFDWIGFIAMSIVPGIALYQGVVAALGVLIVFDSAVEDAAGMLTIVLCALLRFRRVFEALQHPAVSRASLYLVGYLAIVLGSTLLVFIDPIERDPSRMIQQFLSTIPAVAMFFVMVSGTGPASAVRSLRASMIVWTIAAAVTPLTAFTPLPIGEVLGSFEGSAGLRSFGVLGDGGTFVVSFLTVAYFSSRRWFAFLLCMMALVLSGSRMALVITAVGIALVIVLANPKRGEWLRGERAFRITSAVLPMILLLVGLQLIVSRLADQLGVLNPIERLRETDVGQNDRLFSVLQGLEWFQLSPIFGSGFNSYYFFSLRSALFGANQSNALNQIVQTLVDGGVLGLALLTLFFFKVLWPLKGTSLIDRRNDPFAVKGWLFAFLILNQTAVYILPAFFLTVLIFGLAGLSMLFDVTARRPSTSSAHRHVSVGEIA